MAGGAARHAHRDPPVRLFSRRLLAYNAGISHRRENIMRIIILCSLLLTACGPSGKIAESQRQELDKAKAVQQQVDQYGSAQRQQLESSAAQ